MKKILPIVILAFSIIGFAPISKPGQNDLLDLTTGTAHSITAVWDVYQKHQVGVMNVKDKTQFPLNCIMLSDAKKSWGTVFAVMYSDKMYYIASFAPLANGESFSGKGEFYWYENNNGKVTQLDHFIGSINPSAGEPNIEYLQNSDKSVVVSIKNKFEVQFFMFKGYVWSLPRNYFDYNPQ